MKQIFAIIISVALNISLNSQPWERFFGAPNDIESGQDLIECYDFGYLIGTSSLNSTDPWIIKTDINGELLWDKVFIWMNKDVSLKRVDQNSTGEMLVTGFINWGGGDQWPMTVKVDECGNKQWCRVYIDEDYEHGVFKDALLLDNGDVVALAHFSSPQNIDQIFLYYIDLNGNLLWVKSYSSKTMHPYVMLRYPKNLFHFNGEYQISGWCYYPYPTNPGTGYKRPFFIGIDSSFQEKWILPFGVNDSLYGEANSLTSLNDSTYMGVGFMYYNGEENSIYMFFNENGEELGYSRIANWQIGSDVEQNIALFSERINDSLFISSTYFGPESYGNPFGELIIDTAGNIYKMESRPNTTGNTTMIKTFNDKYIITCSYRYTNSDRDIYLYKVNDSLQWDSVYSGNYTYDSLCPTVIQSEIIDVSNCLVFTDVTETPTPEEYFASLNTIYVKAFPNPTNSGSITLQYSNTEHHNNIEMRCFNIHGEEVHTERIYRHQGESLIDVENWPKGMYLAIVYSDNKPVGKIKFIVR